MAEPDNNLELGNSFVSGRICNKTKKQYKQKFDHFKKWVRLKHAHVYSEENDTVDIEQLDSAILTEFFGHISKKRKLKEETEENPYVYVDPVQHQSFQHVSGYKSAIINEFRNRSVFVPDRIQITLTGLFGGYKRTVADLKQTGDMPMMEGRQPMTFDGVRFLVRQAMKQTSDFPLAIFAHIFVLLCWNLVARSVSVSSLMYDHISWDADSMVIVFPTHKGDKEGNTCSPKHVFANPTEPEICPVLWLAVHVFCSGFRRTDSSKCVFGGADAVEGRFSKWLKAVCTTCQAALMAMGLMIMWIGSHSFRKGVATFLSSMCGGPGPIAIYLRAGWSLGPVQSRYILEGGGGDQLCGRAATGLPLTDPTFASLPPHFDLPNGEILSIEQWELILPGYSTFYPTSFQQVVPFLLASLIYHKQFLKDHLPAQHPLFLTRVWTSGLMDGLAPRVHAGCGRNPVTKLTATGIPPHIVLANEIVELKTELRSLREELIDRLVQMPQNVSSHMRNEFTIEGAVQITRADVQSLIAEMESRVLSAFGSAITTLQVTHNAAVSSTALHSTDAVEFRSFTWDGRMHNVPQDFNFPK